jgi:protein-disulfide isomerase
MGLGRLWGIIIGPVVLASAGFGADPALFQYKGRTYRARDLPVASQLELFESEEARYQKLESIAESAMLREHFAGLAKAKGLTTDEVEKTELAVTEPSDKDASLWFDANKGRLPSHMTLDQVKSDILSYLRNERQAAKRKEWIARLKKEGSFKILQDPPEAPRVALTTDGRPTRGAAKAKVTIVEFADYQCPHCKEAGEVLERVLKTYDGKVNLVYLDFPINPSGVSLAVAHGAVCADEQGRYWDYHDKAFAQQRSLDAGSPAKLAEDVKLDMARFKACLESPRPKERVAQDRAQGERLGLSGTPAIFVAGLKVRGYDQKELEAAIDGALKAP